MTNSGHPAVAIGVFGRLPRPGTGKTRLAADIGAERAAALAAAFLADALARVLGVSPGGAWWWIAPEAGRADSELLADAAASGLAPAGIRFALQRGDHLGERMADALATMLVEGPALLAGGDVPDLPLDAFARATALLTAATPGGERTPRPTRLVLGPAHDGGFYLIGCDAPPGELLAARATWGDATVCERTRDDAARRGWHVELLDGWDDVDTAADLAALAARLEAARRHGGAARPDWPARTAALLLAEDQGAAAPPVGG